jgi:hypothetical protein
MTLDGQRDGNLASECCGFKAGGGMAYASSYEAFHVRGEGAD